MLFTSGVLDQRFGLRQHSGASFSHCHRLICIASYSQQGIVSKVSPNLHAMALTLAIGRWNDLTPSLASGESVQRLMGDLNSQNKISELLEVFAAIVVTAGLVAGNLLLFSPLRVDKRIKAPAPPAQPQNTAGPVFR